MVVAFDTDKWLEIALKCRYLPEGDFRHLCDIVSSILLEEPNVLPVTSPVTVCGDIHGQFYDLRELLVRGGPVPETAYIFMGDFVDRGYYSLETLTLLMVLKAKHPAHVTLLRGNHESRQITQVYGFYDECMTKYGNPNSWRLATRIFDLLPIAALIDNEVLCVHGGLSPEVRSVDKIRTIPRDMEIPHKGAFCDLMWSDPEDSVEWAVSPRGAGWLFGESVATKFLSDNKLSLICRAHQLVNEGYKYMFGDKLVTIWSAPNYCYRCGNIAAIIQFNPGSEPGKPGDRKPILFEAVPDENRVVPPSNATPYFL